MWPSVRVDLFFKLYIYNSGPWPIHKVSHSPKVMLSESLTGHLLLLTWLLHVQTDARGVIDHKQSVIVCILRPLTMLLHLRSWEWKGVATSQRYRMNVWQQKESPFFPASCSPAVPLFCVLVLRPLEALSEPAKNLLGKSPGWWFSPKLCFHTLELKCYTGHVCLWW